MYFYLVFQALTTGGIPGFIDVVLNFDSKSLAEDNMITQLERAGEFLQVCSVGKEYNRIVIGKPAFMV